MGAYVQSAGFTVLSFALVISVVVFFHELGHLLVGKAVGVKAVRFSIGFGPRLFSFQKGETEYRLSLLPLGGYVKFAGDNPYEEVAPEDRGRGFLEQAPWKKGLIAAAGPMANFVLAIVFFSVVFASPRTDIRARVGYVKPESPAAAAGLRYGDQVVAIDGNPIEGWMMMQEEIRAHGGETLSLRVLRDGKPLDLQIVPAMHEETNPIETVKHGRIGVAAVPRSAAVTVVSPESPAGRAGVQTFDKVVSLDGQPVPNWEDLAQKLESKSGPITLQVLRPRAIEAPGATLWAHDPITLQLAAPEKPGAYGLEASDMTLFVVQPGSGAWDSGLRRGDKILSVAGKRALAWTDEVEPALAAAFHAEAPAQLKLDPVPFVVRRDGKELSLQVLQKLHRDRDETGFGADLPELGALPGLLSASEPERVTLTYSPLQAVTHAVSSTGEMLRSQALGIARMVSGHIPARSMGSILLMADVARKAADQGWREVLQTMGLISVMLGFMNLLPVPVLDGFHVLSAFIEGIRKKPLSLRFREVSNVVGLALLFTLMLYAVRNDLMRKFFQ
jgi:regulator of sigma E protease